MKRLILVIIVISLSFTFLSSRNTDAAVMEDYCQVPPYVVQNIPPNVMIVLDNSGSMFRFAYYDGYTTPTVTGDDNDCRNSGTPCTGFTEPGAYPTYKYYGYFDEDYWYDYTSNRFVPTAPKTGSGLPGERAKLSSEWDGNFLNWLAMRRVDIMRKVMTGGKDTSGEGAGYSRLIGEKADYYGRGIYKRITTAENYVDSNSYSGTRCFRFDTGSGTSWFDISSGASCTSSFGSNYNVAVRVPDPVEGVLQEVIGTRARIGLSFYNVNNTTPQGGRTRVYVSGGSLSSTVNEINLSRPDSNTPLAETLWTEAGYFAQVASMEGGPGPRYQSGDYQINNNVDPLNYGTGGQPRYPSCAESFVLYLTDGEPCADGNLPETIKDYANGRSIYDCYDLVPGDPTDRSETGNPGRDGYCPAVSATLPGETFSFPASNLPSCYGGGQGGNVAGMEDVALWAHTTDLRSSTLGKNDINRIQNLTLYTVFAFGKGSTLLRYASINGGFEDVNGNNLPDLQSEWDQNNDGEPDTFYEATDGKELEKAIRNALSSILKRASSGTAASVLASGEGQGANLIQAVFYPRRRFGNDVIMWTGVAQNLWYYIDPFFGNSSIREDSTQDGTLNLTNDYIVTLYFDVAAQRTKALLCSDTDGDGDCDTSQGSIFLEDLTNLWEAGGLLWDRDITTDSRTIYTTIDGSSFLAGNFTTGNASTLADYLQATDINGINGSTDEAEYIIKYINGEGLTTEDLDGDGIPDVAGVDLDGDGIDDYRSRTVTIGSDTKVWKLSDILNSTPRVSSWIPLNTYDEEYDDTTYEDYLNTSDYCSITTSQSCNSDADCPGAETCTNNPTAYKNRGMVFTGGNDGMLHAFKLGKLEFNWSGQNSSCPSPPPASNNQECEPARLINPDPSTPLGKEMWAFIPKNALPYLKYIGDPEYCRVSTIDLSPYIFDASVGTTGCSEANYEDCLKTGATVNEPKDRWRTIIIGGMRTGGACRATTTVCSDVSGDGEPDCVNTPVDVGGSSVGYSSYFALDITDQNNPEFLWEFSHEELGFATTGPVIVRIGDNPNKNGKWFVVFGSGPTGPIDITERQFLARSDQDLKFFIFDVKNGPGVNNANVTVKEPLTPIPYAFAASMLNTTNDPDIDYQDDVLYVGYVKRTGAGTVPDPYAWTDGGVGRLMTKEDLNPGNWVWSTVIDGIGPITTSIAKLQNDSKGILWLYFATGRWFYVLDGVSDDTDGQRTLFGIKEPCFSSAVLDGTCTTTVDFSTLTDVTDILNVPTEATADSAGFNGWYINLDPTGSYTYAPSTTAEGFSAERVITNPSATVTGLVFFASFKPYSDECGLGGKTFIWATKYNTGGAGGALLKGKVIIQVSTASIEQVDLPDAFTEAGGRKTSAIEGVPPTSQGLSILSPPPPIKRTVHTRER